MFEELDTVELTHDILENGLKSGDIGAVVNVYDNGSAYEVEFVAPNGRTRALLTLKPIDIRKYINKDRDFSSSLNVPISRGTVSGVTTFTVSEENRWGGLVEIINIDEWDIKTESKENIKKFRYPIAAL
ncbi:DUF4926 domain-containing protein [Patescibacteria group bacterium]|nr:DUF4926 domain-containing protein [Patescibacteria group bacterium]MBU4099206.1 DUF4926 domain-containing protein [Patescibacteria group bacterium]